MIRRKSTVATFMLLVLLVLPLAADQKPSFVFGGKQIFVGMSMSEAVRLLSDCCRLSPPMENKIEENPVMARGGHFIVSKSQPETILGTIQFVNHQVVRMTKPIADDVDFSKWTSPRTAGGALSKPTSGKMDKSVSTFWTNRVWQAQNK